MKEDALQTAQELQIQIVKQVVSKLMPVSIDNFQLVAQIERHRCPAHIQLRIDGYRSTEVFDGKMIPSAHVGAAMSIAPCEELVGREDAQNWFSETIEHHCGEFIAALVKEIKKLHNERSETECLTWKPEIRML